MVNTKIRLIIFFAAKDGEALYSQQKQDLKLTVASDHELLISKFRLIMKGGKFTGPFRYDINQIPYGYSMDVSLSELRELVMDREACDSWGRKESDTTERLN